MTKEEEQQMRECYASEIKIKSKTKMIHCDTNFKDIENTIISEYERVPK